MYKSQYTIQPLFLQAPAKKNAKECWGYWLSPFSPRAHFTSCAETDEDFIEEMFSEVGMEQDYDGFHVV